MIIAANLYYFLSIAVLITFVEIQSWIGVNRVPAIFDYTYAEIWNGKT